MKKYFAITMVIILAFLFMSFTNNNTKVEIQQFPLVNTSTLIFSETQTDSLDKIVQTIINLCANDFYKHQHPAPAGFKDVRMKRIQKSDGEELYILCGQFLIIDKEKKDEWIQFVTIKNSNYEQYIGANAVNFCQNSKEIPYSKYDLSAALKSKLDSLQKDPTKI